MTSVAESPAHAISAENIKKNIGRFASLTSDGPGVTRLAYSQLEREAHAYFAETMTGLGLTVKTDAAGNTIAQLDGESGLPALGTGSHLDSVPNGGKFDGIAGVCAAIEVARAAASLPRLRPWRFLVFASEEGARFGQACNGSRAIAGLAHPATLRSLTDTDGVSMWDAMSDVGLRPDDIAETRWDPADWHGFVELHVEQGNVLESDRLDIGVVDSISGSSRLLVHVSGISSHSGATPMRLRKDALNAAAECVLLGERVANDPQHRGTRVTVGRFDVMPDSITTIPGSVSFSVDVRDLDSNRQRETAKRLTMEFEAIAERRDVGIAVDVIGDTSPAILPSRMVDTIVAATKHNGLTYRVMPSGASHDAQQISRVTPTGMIFVPSRDGLSHVPEEWTSYEEIASGAAVLLTTLTMLDAEEDRR